MKNGRRHQTIKTLDLLRLLLLAVCLLFVPSRLEAAHVVSHDGRTATHFDILSSRCTSGATLYNGLLCENNPVSFVDPNGKSATEMVVATGIGVTLLTIGYTFWQNGPSRGANLLTNSSAEYQEFSNALDVINTRGFAEQHKILADKFQQNDVFIAPNWAAGELGLTYTNWPKSVPMLMPWKNGSMYFRKSLFEISTDDQKAWSMRVKLASVMVHEATHIQKGANELIPHDEQFRFLRQIWIDPETTREQRLMIRDDMIYPLLNLYTFLDESQPGNLIKKRFPDLDTPKDY